MTQDMKLYKVRLHTECFRDVYVEAASAEQAASRVQGRLHPVEAVTPWNPVTGDPQGILIEPAGSLVTAGRAPDTAVLCYPIGPPPAKIASRACAARSEQGEKHHAARRRPAAWPDFTTQAWTDVDGAPAAAYVETPGRHACVMVRASSPRGAQWRRKGAMSSGASAQWAAEQGYAVVPLDGHLPTSVAALVESYEAV